jgi:D-alanyl-D-alanine carboxypeptidase
MPSDWEYLEWVKSFFAPYGTEFYYVELVADRDVRMQRNVTENRLEHKASKRDIEASNARLLRDDAAHRMESLPGEIPFENYIKIDNTELAPETVAQMTAEGASGDGLLVAEELTVRDLLYAIGLESDGIAAVALAKYIAGSEAAFVELMNKKAKEDLKLIRTTFENCTGLYHDNHRTTCREMASIMLAAMDNETVRTVLSTKIYETTTNLRPNGRSFESTYFIDVVNSYRDRGFQAQPAGGTVVAAKTGWVGPESGYCLVSYFVQSQTGKAYVAMTGNAGGALQYLQDHIMLYEDYTQQ